MADAGKEYCMGGNSKNATQNTSVLGSTTTANPYVVSTTNNNGTNSYFQDNTALKTVYDTVNQNIGQLLQDYLNPNLDSTSNQAKLNTFRKTLSNETKTNLENDIINPLSKRNMIRSSQATDLYNKAAANAQNQIANYSADLLANAQDNTAAVINNLLNAYLQGYNVINNNQAQSLNTSRSNASQYSSGKQTNKESLMDWLKFANDWRTSDSQIFSNVMGSMNGFK